MVYECIKDTAAENYEDRQDREFIEQGSMWRVGPESYTGDAIHLDNLNQLSPVSWIELCHEELAEYFKEIKPGDQHEISTLF